jgi:hypothetical protein
MIHIGGKVQKQTHIEAVIFWVIYDLHKVHNIGMIQLLHNCHLIQGNCRQLFGTLS